MIQTSNKPLANCEDCPNVRMVGRVPLCAVLHTFRSPCFVRELQEKHWKENLQEIEVDKYTN